MLCPPGPTAEYAPHHNVFNGLHVLHTTKRRLRMARVSRASLGQLPDPATEDFESIREDWTSQFDQRMRTEAPPPFSGTCLMCCRCSRFWSPRDEITPRHVYNCVFCPGWRFEISSTDSSVLQTVSGLPALGETNKLYLGDEMYYVLARCDWPVELEALGGRI